MPGDVAFSDDPAWVLTRAGPFFASEPVCSNLIMTLLHGRVSRPQPGRYWVADHDDEVVGVVFHSPLTYRASLSVAGPEVAVALADAIADAGITLPGCSGEAEAAAAFAGQWTERKKVAAQPLQGQRIYEASAISGPTVGGRMRNAIPSDRELLIVWMRGFLAEIGDEVGDAERAVDTRLADGQLWVWDDGRPVSMAAASRPVERVVRIGPVFTPRDERNHGYASACVAELSGQFLGTGHRCILYTDLANPTSNSIYRRMGYRAVYEVLGYKFG